MQNPYKSKSVINPQAENGHRRINNDVYHALSMYPFTLAELRVVLTAIDRTWGWDLKSAPISLNKFMAATNLSRQGVVKAVKGLTAKKVLLVKHGKAPKQSEYLFNKHFDTWLDSQPVLSTLIPQPKPEQLNMDSQPVLPIKEGDSQQALPKDSQQALPIIVNERLLLIVNWPDRPLKLLQQSIQQYFTTKDTYSGPLKPEALEALITKYILNLLRARIYELLKEVRGYDSPNSGAEAKSMTWMLKHDYSITDIMSARKVMAKQPYWKDKELLLPSVQGQIGKIKKGSSGGLSTTEKLEQSWK